MGALELREHGLGAFVQLAAPPCQVLATDRLGSKGRVVATAFGQGAVHLSRAQPELAGQCQKEMVGVGPIRGAAGRECPRRRLVERVVEIAGQVIECQSPAVSLIADEAGQHAERARLAVRIARQRQLNRGEERRRVGEPGALDQEAAHLDLGMRPGLQVAIQLQDGVIFIEHRAVRLLAADAPRHQPFRQRRRREQRGMAEADLAAGLAILERYGRLAPKRIEHRQREGVLRQRIDQRPFAPRLAQLGQGYR